MFSKAGVLATLANYLTIVKITLKANPSIKLYGLSANQLIIVITPLLIM